MNRPTPLRRRTAAVPAAAPVPPGATALGAGGCPVSRRLEHFTRREEQVLSQVRRSILEGGEVLLVGELGAAWGWAARHRWSVTCRTWSAAAPCPASCPCGQACAGSAGASVRRCPAPHPRRLQRRPRARPGAPATAPASPTPHGKCAPSTGDAAVGQGGVEDGHQRGSGSAGWVLDWVLHGESWCDTPARRMWPGREAGCCGDLVARRSGRAFGVRPVPHGRSSRPW